MKKTSLFSAVEKIGLHPCIHIVLVVKDAKPVSCTSKQSLQSGLQAVKTPAVNATCSCLLWGGFRAVSAPSEAQCCPRARAHRAGLEQRQSWGRPRAKPGQRKRPHLCRWGLHGLQGEEAPGRGGFVGVTLLALRLSAAPVAVSGHPPSQLRVRLFRVFSAGSWGAGGWLQCCCRPSLLRLKLVETKELSPLRWGEAEH